MPSEQRTLEQNLTSHRIRGAALAEHTSDGTLRVPEQLNDTAGIPNAHIAVRLEHIRKLTSSLPR